MPARKRWELVVEASRWMEVHLQEGFRAVDLAAALQTPVRTLQWSFAQELGRSPSAHARLLRLHALRRRLQQARWRQEPVPIAAQMAASTGGNCSVPSSNPNYLCNGSPLQAFDGGVIQLKESAVAPINMDLDRPYSETYAGTTGNLLADAYSYVQPTATLSGPALRALFDQPGLRTGGVPYALDVNGPLSYPLPQGVVPQGPLLAAIPDADGANQLINPIDGLVITKDVYGNPRTAFGTRDIGAVQTPGPLPIAGFGVAFGWSRRLRRRIRTAK